MLAPVTPHTVPEEPTQESEGFLTHVQDRGQRLSEESWSGQWRWGGWGTWPLAVGLYMVNHL